MGKFYLILLFIGICLTLFFRISIEETAYTSPDSHIYLRVAENVKEGKGLLMPASYPFDEKTGEIYFAMWPAGYPLMIAFVSGLSSTSALVASKMINLFFLGLIFYLLWRWRGNHAWFPALYFCSFGMLEVFSYTWTEGPFLFFVLFLCHLISKALQQQQGPYFFLELFICLAGLFMLRYAGLIYFFFAGAFLLYFYTKGEKKTSLHFFLALLLSSILVAAYFMMNYQETAYFTGGNRFTNDISLNEFFLLFVQGVLNETFIIRNYYFTGYTDYLFLILLLLQLSLLVFLFYQRSFLFKLVQNWRSLSTLLLIAGFFYLPFILLLSYVLYFDLFYYRILAPFSMPVFVGLLMALTHKENHAYFLRTRAFIVAFMMLSLLMNLPKQFILDRLTAF